MTVNVVVLASAEKPFGVSILIDNIVYGTGMAASKKAAKNAAGRHQLFSAHYHNAWVFLTPSQFTSFPNSM